MMLRKTFKNFFVLLSGTLAGQFFLFLGVTLVARLFGPAVFGLWNFAQTYTMYLFRLNELGLEVIGIKKISAAVEPVPEIIMNTIAIRVVLAIVLTGVTVILFLLDLFPKQTGVLVLISSISVLPIAVTVEWVFESLMELKPVMVSRFVKGFLFFAMAVVFLSDAADAALAMIFYVLSIAIPTVALLIFVVVKFNVKFSFDLRKGAAMLKESLPIGSATLVSNYNLFIGTFILTYMASAETLGFYSAAQRIIVLFGALIVANAHRILLPIFYRSHAESTDSFRNITSLFFRIFSIGAFFGSLVMISISKDIIPMVFGASFYQSVEIFSLLGVSLIFYITRSILEIGYIASHAEKRYLYSNVLAAVLYTALIPLGVTVYGITGVGYAAIAAEVLTLTFQVLYFQLLPVSFAVPAVIKPAAAFVAGFGAEYSLRQSATVLHLLMPAAVFLGTLVLFNGVTRKDVRSIAMKLAEGRVS